jgi:hypothetical protein
MRIIFNRGLKRAHHSHHPRSITPDTNMLPAVITPDKSHSLAFGIAGRLNNSLSE